MNELPLERPGWSGVKEDNEQPTSVRAGCVKNQFASKVASDDPDIDQRVNLQKAVITVCPIGVLRSRQRGVKPAEIKVTRTQSLSERMPVPPT